MTELYKGRFPCHPTFQLDSSRNKTIDWTLKMDPPESIYWKTGKIKKRDIRILSKVTPGERKEFTDEIFLDIYPPIIKQQKVKQL